MPSNLNSHPATNRLKIAEILCNTQEYVSGEVLAKKLGISRTAVWKQIQKIRNDDFIVETKRKVGYKIVSRPDKLLPALVERGLKTTLVGRKIYYYQTVDSTNSLAKNLAQEGVPEGSLVIAEEQLGGRGRRGRHWLSPKGASILASLILRPDIVPHQVPEMAVLGALSVAESINCITGIRAELRWPNEVLLNNKRVAGVLTEFGAELDEVSFVILGMGINVNLTLTEFAELAAEATSLSIESGGQVSRLELLQILLEQIEQNYVLLKNGKFSEICQRWNAICWHPGERVRVVSPEGSRSGVLQGIDDNGCLVIIEADGESKIAMSGDISVKAV